MPTRAVLASNSAPVVLINICRDKLSREPYLIWCADPKTARKYCHANRGRQDQAVLVLYSAGWFGRTRRPRVAVQANGNSRPGLPTRTLQRKRRLDPAPAD